MTSDEFAEAIVALIAEAEDVGLDPEKILAELKGMVAAMRLCIDE